VREAWWWWWYFFQKRGRKTKCRTKEVKKLSYNPLNVDQKNMQHRKFRRGLQKRWKSVQLGKIEPLTKQIDQKGAVWVEKKGGLLVVNFFFVFLHLFFLHIDAVNTVIFFRSCLFLSFL